MNIVHANKYVYVYICHEFNQLFITFTHKNAFNAVIYIIYIYIYIYSIYYIYIVYIYIVYIIYIYIYI